MTPSLQLNMYCGDLSWRIEQPGQKADHSFQYSINAKNAGRYTFTPPHIFLLWCFINHGVTLPLQEHGDPELSANSHTVFLGHDTDLLFSYLVLTSILNISSVKWVQFPNGTDFH